MDFVKLYSSLESIEKNVSALHKKLDQLDHKVELSLKIQRNHLIRLKKGEDLPDELILQGRPYNDLSPQKAFEIFEGQNSDFILLDVSHSTFKHPSDIQGALHIPLEELSIRYSDIVSKTTPILIISEKGIRSIQAAEFLVTKGYFNTNNISGGHHHWPGHKNNQANPDQESN